MDHVRRNAQTRHFVYPPKVGEEEFILDFADGLKEIIPVKLKELMDRQDELAKVRKEKLGHLETLELDDFARYFNTLLIEYDFTEYDIINRWLKYWLRIAEKSGNNSSSSIKIQQESEYTEAQLELAREYPIEDLYEGKLKQLGSRFSGLCPFHNESTPSLIIYGDGRGYYCFGCNANGDAIDFYMRIHKCHFKEAVQALLNL